MQPPPPLPQEAVVGHLVGQGMLEGVVRLGEQAGLVEELGGLQVRQAAVQGGLGQLGDGLEQRQGHLSANDGRGLEEPLLLRWQPVDACRQDRLHRGRHLKGRERLRQAVGPGLAHQLPERQGRLHRALRQLLQRLRNPKRHQQQRRRALQHDPAEPLHLRHERLLPAAGRGPRLVGRRLARRRRETELDGQHRHRLVLHAGDGAVGRPERARPRASGHPRRGLVTRRGGEGALSLGLCSP